MIKELVHDEAVLSTPCEAATAADADVAQDWSTRSSPSRTLRASPPTRSA